jgi:hypothetical protein
MIQIISIIQEIRMLRQIMACKMMMEVGVVIVMKKMWTTMMIQLGKFVKVQLKLLMPLFPLVLKL